MKNLFKKLSFVLALAMIISTISPAAGALAATKAPKLTATKVYLHLDKDGANEYDFNISNKVKGWAYKWTSANKKVATVNSKNGLTTAAGAGTTSVAVVISKDGETYKTLKATVVVRDNIKTLTITNKPAGDKLAVGATNDFNRSYVTNSGSTTKTSGITRWAIAEEGATITDSGLFTATKAGVYTITANSFQSKAKYTSWLADSAKYAGYVTATVTYKVTVAASMVDVKQINTTKFAVTFDSATTDVANKISVSSLVGTTKVKELVKSVTMDTDNKVATVELYVPVTAGTTYVVDYPEMTSVQFVAATQKVEDVTSIKVVTTSAEIGVKKTVEIALYNKDGVNIANDELLSRVTLATSNSASNLDGKDLYLYKVGDTTTITATFHTYNYDLNGTEIGNLTAAGTVTCTDQSVDSVGMLSAFTVEDMGNDPDFLTVKHSIAAEDSSLKLFVQLKGKEADGDDYFTTNYADTNFKFTTSNSDVLIVGETTGSVYPVKAGSAVVVVKYKDTVVGAATITVTAKRELANATLNTQSVVLSNTAAFADMATVSVDTHKDQLGDDVAYNVSISSNSSDDHGLLTNPASTSTFIFDATDIPTGTYTYLVTVVDVNNSAKKFVRLVSVTVQAPTNDTVAYYRLEADKSEYDMKIATGNTTEVATLTVFGYASNNVKNYKSTLAASGYTFTLDAPSAISSTEKAAALAEISSGGSITFISTTSGGAVYAKLPTGNYTVKGTNGTTNNLTAYFNVTDTQEKPVLVVNKTYSDVNDIAGAVIDCVSVTLHGKTITLSSNIANYTVVGNTGKTAFVKEVVYYETIAGVSVKHTIAINRSISYNQD